MHTFIMEISDFLIIVATGVVGGFFNTFVGAGSLITIPVLMIVGLPPHFAIGTNRLGVIGSDIAGWYEFNRKGMIDYKAAIILAVPALIGAFIGANIVLEFDEVHLKRIVAGVTVIILVLIMLNPGAGVRHSRVRLKKHQYTMAVITSFLVGIYGGFYGAGAGTFLFYILILIFGETFMESAGTHKIANFSFSAMAAAIFAYKGVINYIWAIPLFIGSFAGSFVSAYYSDKIGNAWLKRIFFVVVSAAVIKLMM